jgi:hypothetical protein
MVLQISQSNQIFLLNSQLHDANHQVDKANQQADSLCTQLLEMQKRYHKEQDATAALNQLLASQDSQNCCSHAPYLPTLGSSKTSTHMPHLSPHHRSPVQHDIHYPDGICTMWIGGDQDSDADADKYLGLNDSPGTRQMTYSDPRSMGIYLTPLLASNSNSTSDCSQEL